MKADGTGIRARVALFLALFGLTAVQAPTPSAAIEEQRWEGVARQVVIPDIHGAHGAFVALLKATGVVDDELNWSAGDTHLVSLGDLLDRGPDSRKAMDLLMRLQQQAREAGGRVHVVLGNHELMNLTGDLRYVSDEEFAAFAADEPQAVREAAFEWFVEQAPGAFADAQAARAAFEEAFPPGYFGLRAAFASDGRYGSWLLDLPVAVVVNDTAYVHGGLPEILSRLPLGELNDRLTSDLAEYVRSWEKLVAAGNLPRFERQDPKDLAAEALFIADPSRCISERAQVCERIDVPAAPGAPDDGELVATLERFIELSDSPALSQAGPLWYRGSVFCRPILEEPVLEAALARLGVNRAIVGHTPTFDRRVHSLYDGRLIMLDTGMLVSYYKGRPAALIIEDGRTQVQYLDPAERTVPRTGGQAIAGELNRAGVLAALAEGDVTVIERRGSGPWRTRVSHEGQELEALFYADSNGTSGTLERAAHALDELMGTDLVPPTVKRSVEGEEGALQFWYPDTITESQRVANELGIGGWCPIEPQFALMSMFDYLTYNAGRSAENILYRRSLWSLRLTGHGRAFSTERRLPDQVSQLELAPGAVEALEALDRERLEAAMDGLLDRRQVRALLARRDAILEATGER